MALYPSIPIFANRYGTKMIPSSWLIEHCGLEEKTFGQAGCYETNSLVIVNRGNATATDILNLSRSIITCVEEHFNVTLAQEVRTIY